MQVLLGNLEGTAQPKCQKDTVNAESVLKALPMLFSAEVLDYFEFLGRFLLLNPNLLVFLLNPNLLVGNLFRSVPDSRATMFPTESVAVAQRGKKGE